MCNCKKTVWRSAFWMVLAAVDLLYAGAVVLRRRLIGETEVTAGQKVRCLQMRLAHADATSALYQGDAWRPLSID